MVARTADDTCAEDDRAASPSRMPVEGTCRIGAWSIYPEDVVYSTKKAPVAGMRKSGGRVGVARGSWLSVSFPAIVVSNCSTLLYTLHVQIPPCTFFS